MKTYLKGFNSKADSVISELMTIEDALSHKAGMSGLDALWLGADSYMPLKRNMAVSIANLLPIQQSFRSGFVYNNSLYSLAGVAVEAMASDTRSTTWEALMREKILEPLGLSKTFSTTAEACQQDNCAVPYMATPDGDPSSISYPEYSEQSFGSPAVGIWSCLEDMLKWAGALLADYQTTVQLQSSPDTTSPSLKNIKKLFGPHTILDKQSVYEQSYGLGVFRQMTPAQLGYIAGNRFYLGDKMPLLGTSSPHILSISHSGNVPGFTTSFYLFPDQQSAIVVLGNAISLGDTPDMVAQQLTQSVLDLKPRVDLVAAAQQCTVEYVTWFQSMRQRWKDEQELGTPSIVSEELVGVYTLVDIDYEIFVEEDENGKLWLLLNNVESQRFKLEHYHYNVFSYLPDTYDEYLSRCLISWWELKMFFLSFKQDANGHVVAVEWAVDGVTPIAIEKR